MNIFTAVAHMGSEALDNAHIRVPRRSVPSHERLMRDPAGYMAEQAALYSGAVARRRILLGGFASRVIYALTNNAYMTGFLLSLGADPSFVNTVVLLNTLCMMLQIFAPFLLERMRRRRNIIIIVTGVNYALNLALIPLLVFAGVPNVIMLPLFAVLTALTSAIGSLMLPGLQAWHIGNIPDEKRLGFFSLVSITGVMMNTLAPFLGGVAADALRKVYGESISLSFVRISLLIFGAVQLYLYYRVDEPKYAGSGEKFSLGIMFRCIKAHPEYLSVILSLGMWNFAALIPGPYLTAHMLEDLGISYTFLSSVGLVYIVAVVLLTPFWKKMLTKLKMNVVFSIVMLMLALYPVGYLFLSADRLFMFPVSEIYSYIFAVAVNLFIVIAPYTNLPEENRTVFLSLFTTIQSLMQILGLFTGRVIYDLCADKPLPFGLPPALALMAVHGGMLAVTGIFIFFALKERPKKGEVRT